MKQYFQIILISLCILAYNLTAMDNSELDNISCLFPLHLLGYFDPANTAFTYFNIEHQKEYKSTTSNQVEHSLKLLEQQINTLNSLRDEYFYTQHELITELKKHNLISPTYMNSRMRWSLLSIVPTKNLQKHEQSLWDNMNQSHRAHFDPVFADYKVKIHYEYFTGLKKLLIETFHHD